MSLQEDLYQYYLADKHVRGMRIRLDSATHRLSVQQGQLQELQAEREQLKETIKKRQAEIANIENEAASIDEKIAKLRDQMNSVKTNKEYSAILVEVSTLKAEKAKREEGELEVMGGVEELEAKLKDVDAKIADRNNLISATEKELAEAQSEVGDELTKLEQQRDEAGANLPDDIIAKFERLAEAYDGEAMAEIEEQDRKRLEYNCGGCFMQVPVDRVNALLLGKEEVVICPSCSRILYVADQLKTSIASK